MSRSKGARVQVLLRVRPDTRDVLRGLAAESGQGVGGVVEEVLALRLDRDAEVARLKGLVEEALVERDALLEVVRGLRRDVARFRRRGVGRRVEAGLGVRVCACGGRLGALDASLGLVDCEECRRRQVESLLGGG